MFSNILIAYDGTDSGHELLNEAIELASTYRSKVHLVAVAYLQPGEMFAESAYPTGILPANEVAMGEALDAAKARFEQHGCRVGTTLMIGNNTVATIRELALQIKADLIILGHRRQGPFSRLWNGSVGMALLANAPCSILVAVTPQVAHASVAAGNAGDVVALPARV